MNLKREDVFLHFHNSEILDAYGQKNRNPDELLRITSLLTRYALFISDGFLIIHPKYLWEAPYFGRYLNTISPLITAGLVAYGSSTSDFERELDGKRVQYRDQKDLFPGYFDPRASKRQLHLLNRLLWVPRLGPSLTEGIGTEWEAELIDDGEISELARRWSSSGLLTRSEAERRLREVPAALAGRAFIVSEVERQLMLPIDGRLRRDINFFINRVYLRLYVQMLDASILVDTPLGQLDFGLIARNELLQKLLVYRKLKMLTSFAGLGGAVEGLSWGNLIELRGDPAFMWIAEQIRKSSTAKLQEESPFAEILRSPFKTGVLEEIRGPLRSLHDTKIHCARLAALLAGEGVALQHSIFSPTVRPSRVWLQRRRRDKRRRQRVHGAGVDDGGLPQSNEQLRLALGSESPILIGLITIKQEEFNAARQRFPATEPAIRGQRWYHVSSFYSRAGRQVKLILANAGGPGGINGQACARDLVEDMSPDLVLLVGIGGGVPSSDYTLGDVVLARGVQDLRIHAEMQDDGRRYSATGYRMPRVVSDLLDFLPAMDLGDWSSEAEIGYTRPKVVMDDEALYGPNEWKESVKASLIRHFVDQPLRGRPIIHVGPVVSTDGLMKSADRIIEIQEFVRDVAAFEMEAGGVLSAMEGATGTIPALIIKGISDIVGLKRSTEWTDYACQSAASLTCALLKSGWLDVEF